MQSNSDFIAYFSKLVAPLRIFLNSKKRFNWTTSHENFFHKLLQGFRNETLLTNFDANKQAFIFTDAHETGLSAILVQEQNISNTKAVAMVSSSTSYVEQNYAQLDLEPIPRFACI